MIEGSIDISYLFEQAAIHSQRAICTSGEKRTRVFYQKDKNNKSIIALIHQSNLAKDKISMSSFHKDDMYVYLEEEKLIFPVSAFTGCVNRHYTL